MKRKGKAATERPLRLEWRTPEELAENPRNWRGHPPEQTQALAGVIRDVGWAVGANTGETRG